MDAHAHLMSLGWQGDGHALDARPYKQKGHRGLAYDPKQVRSTGGNGLVKPLLISQRQHRFGIGKKAHEPPAGNEWWLSGFEKALGNIGKSESERESTSATASGTTTPESSSGYKGKHAGLYGFFVKGQSIGGTIEEEPTKRAKKRKSGEMGHAPPNTTGEQSSSDAAAKNRRKGDTAEEFEQVGAFLAVRDKDERRRKKAEKADPLEQFQQVGEFFEARSEKRKQEKRRSEIFGEAETQVDAVEESVSDRVETQEERRERRRRRKEEKAAKAGIEAVKNHDTKPGTDYDKAAAKAPCKAERSRKKEDARQS